MIFRVERKKNLSAVQNMNLAVGPIIAIEPLHIYKDTCL